ncbi:MAG: hypothetical protein GY797_07440 [Deltaproteobacteria bacterium]|nr:hypothetical protein [Deltaproteobacteria bacterium]
MNQSRKDNTLCVINTPDNFINYMMKRSIWDGAGTIDQGFFAEVSRKYQRNSTVKQILLKFLSFPGEFRYSSKDLYTHYTINSYLSFLLLPGKSYHSSELLKVREEITKAGGFVKSTYLPIVSQHDSLHSQRYSSFLSNRVLCGVSKYNVHNALHVNRFSDALDIYNGIKYFIERFISKTYFMLVPEILERLNLHKIISNSHYNRLATILPLFPTPANDYYQDSYHTGRSKESHMRKATPLESDSILILPSLYGRSIQKANERQQYQHYKESTSPRSVASFFKPGITRTYFDVYSERLNKFTGDVLSRFTHEKDVVRRRRTECSEDTYLRKTTPFESDSTLILPSLNENSMQKANETQRRQHYKESTSPRSIGHLSKPGITRTYFDVYSERLNKFAGDVLSRVTHEKDVVMRTERCKESHVKKAPQLMRTPSLALPVVYGKSIQGAKERQRYQNRKESTSVKKIVPILKPDITSSHFDVYSETFNKFIVEVFRRFSNHKKTVKRTERSKEPHVTKAIKATSDLHQKLSKLYNIPTLKGKTIQRAFKNETETSVDVDKESLITINRVKGFYLKRRSIDNKTQMDIFNHNLTHTKQIAILRKGYTSKTMNEELEYSKLSTKRENAFSSRDTEVYKNSSYIHLTNKMNVAADGYSDQVYAHNPSDMVHYSSGRLPKSSGTMPKEKVDERTGDRGINPSYREDIEKTVQLREHNPQAIAEKVYEIIIEKIKREREMRG